jgi:predicted  nucleic acid-binding Zn-ribbon protein
MGPTNIALVKLFIAETRLREAQRRLTAVTRNVRQQQDKVTDLAARRDAAQSELNKARAKSAELDLEIKSRDEKIETMRTQQAAAQTNREYQAFLVQINTHKADRGKIEDDMLKLIEQAEKLQTDLAGLTAQAETESAKLQQMHGDIDARVKMLSDEVAAAQPERDEAAAGISPRARELFDKLADKFDGEAMAPIEKPHPKREEYICSVCNLDLTLDVYNRLHTRDEPVMCPSGNHLLYIPDDLPPEKAVHKPKEKKAPRPKAVKGVKKKDIGAPVALQTLASSVVTSVDTDDETAEQAAVVAATLAETPAPPAPSEPTGSAAAEPPQSPPIDQEDEEAPTTTASTGAGA